MEITAALLASLNVTRAQYNAREASIVQLVTTNDKAVLAAVQRIYAWQESDEAHTTIHDNDRGFQKMDAKFGGKMARLLNMGEEIYPCNMPRLRRMAVKYRRQLTVLSFLKERAKREADLVWVLTDDDTWVDTSKAA